MLHTIEIGTAANLGFFTREPNAKHSLILHCPYHFSYFPFSSILSYSCQRMRGQGKWHSCYRKQHCTHLLAKKAIVELHFPLSSDVFSIIVYESTPQTLSLYSLKFLLHSYLPGFCIYSRQHLIEILNMAWTLNDKQMKRRSDENHTCLKAMCFHVKYIWDF